MHVSKKDSFCGEGGGGAKAVGASVPKCWVSHYHDTRPSPLLLGPSAPCSRRHRRRGSVTTREEEEELRAVPPSYRSWFVLPSRSPLPRHRRRRRRSFPRRLHPRHRAQVGGNPRPPRMQKRPPEPPPRKRPCVLPTKRPPPP